MLNQLEKEGYILTGNYNKQNYDRTKWYTMPEFAVKTPESLENQPLDKNDQSNGQNCPMDWSKLSNGLVKNDQPIPNVNTDNKPNSKPDDTSGEQKKR